MSIFFRDYWLFSFSTGNQTVNFIPAKQLKLNNIILACTEKEKGENLKNVLKKHGIKFKNFDIPNNNNILELKNQFLDKTQEIKNIIWNITGGQKYHNLAMYEAYKERQKNKNKDYILYFNANPPEILIYDEANKILEMPVKVDITLDDIFTLYNTSAFEKTEIYPNPDDITKQNLEIGIKALEHYEKDELFRKLFFAVMKPNPLIDGIKENITDTVRKLLNLLVPKVNELKITRQGYENLEKNITIIIKKALKSDDIFEIKNLIKKLSLISNPEEIFNEYWNSIKRALIVELSKKINEKDYPLLYEKIDPENFEKLKKMINSIGGEIVQTYSEYLNRSYITNFSKFNNNGTLFEWMVAGKIIEIISRNNNLKERISQIHLNVMTKQNKENAEVDAELDIVITTKFGTTVVLEAKTYDFSGETIESKENQTLKKSGPYSKTIIVGPLLKKLSTEKDNKLLFPNYFDSKIIDQKRNAEKHNINYSYLDELEIFLEREILK